MSKREELENFLQDSKMFIQDRNEYQTMFYFQDQEYINFALSVIFGKYKSIVKDMDIIFNDNLIILYF